MGVDGREKEMPGAYWTRRAAEERAAVLRRTMRRFPPSEGRLRARTGIPVWGYGVHVRRRRLKHIVVIVGWGA